MDLNFSKLQELVIDREAWHAVVYGVEKSQTWLSDWTELKRRPWLVWVISEAWKAFKQSAEELEAKGTQTFNYDWCWF